MEEIFDKLANAIVEMEEDEVAELAQYCIDNGIDAFDAIDKGLTRGMEEAGKLFEEEEYFVPRGRYPRHWKKSGWANAGYSWF